MLPNLGELAKEQKVTRKNKSVGGGGVENTPPVLIGLTSSPNFKGLPLKSS